MNAAREVNKFDKHVIHWLKKNNAIIARVALAIVFFWFGALKVAGTSAANPLVSNLMERTMPFMTFHFFIICFGFFEMFIGLLFLVRGHERLAIILLFIHMVSTFLPLVLLPAITWHGYMVPSMEGQYIIKNVVIIALALSIAASLHPLKLGNV